MREFAVHEDADKGDDEGRPRDVDAVLPPFHVVRVLCVIGTDMKIGR